MWMCWIFGHKYFKWMGDYSYHGDNCYRCGKSLTNSTKNKGE